MSLREQLLAFLAYTPGQLTLQDENIISPLALGNVVIPARNFLQSDMTVSSFLTRVERIDTLLTKTNISNDFVELLEDYVEIENPEAYATYQASVEHIQNQINLVFDGASPSLGDFFVAEFAVLWESVTGISNTLFQSLKTTAFSLADVFVGAINILQDMSTEDFGDLLDVLGGSATQITTTFLKSFFVEVSEIVQDAGTLFSSDNADDRMSAENAFADRISALVQAWDELGAPETPLGNDYLLNIILVVDSLRNASQIYQENTLLHQAVADGQASLTGQSLSFLEDMIFINRTDYAQALSDIVQNVSELLPLLPFTDSLTTYFTESINTLADVLAINASTEWQIQMDRFETLQGLVPQIVAYQRQVQLLLSAADESFGGDWGADIIPEIASVQMQKIQTLVLEAFTERSEFTATTLEDIRDNYHYTRNQNQGQDQDQNDIPSYGELLTLGFTKLTDDASVFHQIGETETGVENVKWVSSDGLTEYVYQYTADQGWQAVTDDVNVGTYNYASPKGDALGHLILDVYAWVLWGNTAADNASSSVTSTFELRYQFAKYKIPFFEAALNHLANGSVVTEAVISVLNFFRKDIRFADDYLLNGFLFEDVVGDEEGISADDNLLWDELNENHHFQGFAGNDIITGGALADIIDGGSGTDTASYVNATSGVSLNLLRGEGYDGYALGDVYIGIENIYGSHHHDVIIGDNRANVIEGLQGADFIDGGGGNDTLSGGDGDDIITGRGTINGDEGDDTLNVYSDVQAIGGIGQDTINFTHDRNIIGRSELTISEVIVNDQMISVDLNNASSHEDFELFLTGLNGNIDSITYTYVASQYRYQVSLGIYRFIYSDADSRLEAEVTNVQGFNDTDLILYTNGTSYDGGGGVDTFVADWSAQTVALTWDLSEAFSALDNGITVANFERYHVRFGEGNDNILGSSNGDYLHGGEGDDTIDGRGGSDNIFGGIGNDVINGNGMLDGGDGNDSITGAGVLNGGSGDDIITGRGQVNGGEGNDLLTVYSDVQATGGAGDDEIYFVHDRNILGRSELKIKEVSVDGVNLTVNLNNTSSHDDYESFLENLNGDIESITYTYVASRSRVQISLGISRTVYSNADSRLEAEITNVQGFTDSDLILYTNGTSYDGGGGVDTFVADWSGQTVALIWDLSANSSVLQNGVTVSNFERHHILFGEGNDDIFGASASDYLHGGNGHDIINGGGGNDILFGGVGHDTLIGGAGYDVAGYVVDRLSDLNISFDESLGIFTIQSAEFGTDTLEAIEALRVNGENYALTGASAFTDGNDIYNGGSTGDILMSLDGDDVVNGMAGNDLIYGGQGADELRGELGDDVLNGGAGQDIIDGGEGQDTASYFGSVNRVLINLLADRAMSGHATGDVLISIENLLGSSFGDELKGDFESNVLSGGDGNDILIGYRGDDLIFGELGRDVLNGGAGADLLDGGAGVDQARYNGSQSSVFIDLLAGTASGGDADGDVLISIENLFGSNHDDTLYGDGNNNKIFGHNGDDALAAGGGISKLYGGNGMDSFVLSDGFAFVMDFIDDVDQLDVSDYGFATLADALLHVDQVGSHARFQFNGDVLFVLNTDMAVLSDDIVI